MTENAKVSGLETAARIERREMDDLRGQIAALEQRMEINAQEQTRAADRLEVELRVASELPHLDTAAFAAAQRQRLGALEHQRGELEAAVDALRDKMLDSFAAVTPLEKAIEASVLLERIDAHKRAQGALDEVAGRMAG
ncbi:MAG: hypothetical protein WA979_03465 [Pacificimonas sp.]